MYINNIYEINNNNNNDEGFASDVTLHCGNEARNSAVQIYHTTVVGVALVGEHSCANMLVSFQGHHL